MNIHSGGKRILIYGDSIVWGRIGGESGRYDEHTRWTCQLQERLGAGFEIIEEGLRGRMLEGDNPNFPERDGLQQFGPILGSHLPLDLVVVSLGANDCNAASNKSPEQIASGLDKYWDKIGEWAHDFGMPVPKLLIVSPPRIMEEHLRGDTKFAGAGDKSAQLAPLYEAKAKSLGVAFFDAAQVAEGGTADGIHLDEAANARIAEALEPVVKDLMAAVPDGAGKW